MSTTRINDDAIWITRIEGNPALQDRLAALKPGELLDLEIDGIVGKWQRMRDGRDGRPTLGIKPVAEMREVWARMRKKPGRQVAVREVVTADSYLAALGPALAEWESPEDERAYRDL
ncbi:MAG: hypothetical protein WEB63_04765 [Cucumibacter sp.]